MIEDSKEWLAALLDSGIISFYRDPSEIKPCRDCGEPLLFGSQAAKLCFKCAAKVQRVRQRNRVNPRAKKPYAGVGRRGIRRVPDAPFIEEKPPAMSYAKWRKRLVAQGRIPA